MLIRIYRIIFFPAVNLIFLVAGGVVNLLLIFSDRRRARTQAVMTMLWAKAACSILGIRPLKSGRRNKDGAHFIVCNHASYVDVFAMGSLRPVAFLSNHEVREWPLFGLLAVLGGVVFVNRNSKRAALEAMTALKRKIEAGVTVVVFPEGTTSNGRTVRPFRSAFFDIPVKQDIPVRPAAIKYPEDVVDSVAWHGGAKILPHFWTLAGIKKIEVLVRFGPTIYHITEGGAPGEARKRLCSLAYESVVGAWTGKQG